MELTPELIQKHIDRLVEAKVTVKGHTRHSKTGKAFNVQQHERDIETKRIGKSTYMKKGNLVARISGPWRPGNVWMAEIHKVKPEFEAAWTAGKVTTRERGVDPTKDSIITAMTWGRANDVDPELTDGPSKDIGYRFKSKALAVAAAKDYLSKN